MRYGYDREKVYQHHVYIKFHYKMDLRNDNVYELQKMESEY